MLLTAILAIPVAGYAFTVSYSADPIDAVVVDAKTKQPIENVIVVAHWVLEGGLHVDRVGELKILETTTNKAGRFHFNGWGPIRHWGNSRLTYMDPELILFKSGYRYLRLTNRATPEAIGGKATPLRRSDWNGKTIALERFEGRLEEYAKHLSFINTSLDFIDENCNWKKVPRIMLALQIQNDVFWRSGITRTPYSLSYLTDTKECGSVKEYFEKFDQ